MKVQLVGYSEVQGKRTCTLEEVNGASEFHNSVNIGMGGMVNKLCRLDQIYPG